MTESSFLFAEVLFQTTDAMSRVGLAFTSLLAQDVAPQAQNPAQGQSSFIEQMFSNPLLPIVVVIFLFYTLILAPERRRKAEEAKLLGSLKKNDRIVTVGGIHGTVVSVSPDSDVVTIKCDESGNTRLKMNRSAISSIVNSSKENKESGSKEADSPTKN